MNWLPGFLAPSAAWLALLAVPLVVLYFLKLKRVRLVVPSLVLWQQVMEDQRVNAPFQRFKRNILLFLQLLLLTLLVLAAMQPFVRGDAGSADRVLVLIDRSASMGALDGPDGATRLEVAAGRVRQMIDALAPDEELGIVVFDRVARQAAAFTSNKRVLQQAVDAIEVVDEAGDVSEALRMAEALRRSTRFDRALLLSDAVIPGVFDTNRKERVARVDFELPFELDFQTLPPAGPNIGITALEARRATGGGWSVFARVESGPSGGAGTLELHQDGEPIAQEPVALDGQPRRIVFDVATRTTTALELRIKPDGFDALAADNRAYLRLTPSRDLTVYCDPELATWRRALRVMDGVRLLPEAGTAAGVLAGGTFDLLITDEPESDIEAAVTLRVGAIPPDVAPVVTRSDDGGAVIDWRRDHALLEHVQFTDVALADRVEWVGEERERALEAAGYEVIMYGGRGPLAVERVTPTRAEYALLFHTDRSTLPYRVGFPIVVSNAVRIARARAGLLERAGDRTGTLPAVAADPGAQVTVELPDGSTRTLAADESGVAGPIGANRAGWYTVRQGGDVIDRVGLSLLDVAETRLEPVARLELAETGVAASASTARVNRPLWPWLVAGALLVLCVEWWYFQRKPGGHAK